MIALAFLSLLVAAASFGLLAREWFIDRWTGYEAGAQAAVTDDTVRWLQLLGNPPANSVPCMSASPAAFPFICGRNNGHAGYHIAFGEGHRIEATWPRERAADLFPQQRDGRGL